MTGDKYRETFYIHDYIIINHYSSFLLYISEFQEIIRTRKHFSSLVMSFVQKYLSLYAFIVSRVEPFT